GNDPPPALVPARALRRPLVQLLLALVVAVELDIPGILPALSVAAGIRRCLSAELPIDVRRGAARTLRELGHDVDVRVKGVGIPVLALHSLGVRASSVGGAAWGSAR